MNAPRLLQRVADWLRGHGAAEFELCHESRAFAAHCEELAAATPDVSADALLTYLLLAGARHPTHGSLRDYVARRHELAAMCYVVLDLLGHTAESAALDLEGALRISAAWIEHVTPAPGAEDDPAFEPDPRVADLRLVYQRERAALSACQRVPL